MAHLEVISSPLLSALPGVRHGFFTRVGGVSEGIYAGLNTGPGSSDQPAQVMENRKRAARWLGVEPERLLTAYQVHSAAALTTAGPFDAGPPRGDALVTRTKALALGALAADCAPVLIADAEARVVAAAHAGWKGALGGVIGAAVDAMIALDAEPARMVAAVGPCIGPDSYEVGLDFLERFTSAERVRALLCARRQRRQAVVRSAGFRSRPAARDGRCPRRVDGRRQLRRRPPLLLQPPGAAPRRGGLWPTAVGHSAHRRWGMKVSWGWRCLT